MDGVYDYVYDQWPFKILSYLIVPICSEDA